MPDLPTDQLRIFGLLFAMFISMLLDIHRRGLLSMFFGSVGPLFLYFRPTNKRFDVVIANINNAHNRSRQTKSDSTEGADGEKQSPDHPFGAKFLMGEGQFNAHRDFIGHVRKYYPRSEENVHFNNPTDDTDKRIDIVSFGGPNNNTFSNLIFKGDNGNNSKFKGFVEFRESDNSLLAVQGKGGGKTEYKSMVRDSRTGTDHAVILMGKRTDRNKGKFLVFAGCRTFGVHGAARYYCKKPMVLAWLNVMRLLRRHSHLMIIIKCDVRDGAVQTTKRLTKYCFTAT
ncbi:MAG: hypothetical protein ABJG15_00425 [Hyphomonadaceae bacterium]